jgi:CRP-like cAMP-binding protein
VSLLDADPSLAADIPEAQRAPAARALRAELVALEAGPVDGGRWEQELRAPAFGLLLVSGCLARESLAGAHGALELLGRGDLLRPWDEPALLDERPPRWRALDRCTLAVLDGPFAHRAAPWPQVAAALLARVMRRNRQASLMLAVRTLPRVEDRVLAVLWLVAERMGQVTPEGVRVLLALRQADVGALAGARRPTVNVTLKLLREEGLLREWTVHGYRLDPRAGEVVAGCLRGEEFAR